MSTIVRLEVHIYWVEWIPVLKGDPSIIVSHSFVGTPLALCGTCKGSGEGELLAINTREMPNKKTYEPCLDCNGEGAKRCGECEVVARAVGEFGPTVCSPESCTSPGCWHGWERLGTKLVETSNELGIDPFAPPITMTDREADEIGKREIINQVDNATAGGYRYRLKASDIERALIAAYVLRRRAAGSESRDRGYSRYR